MKWCETCPLRLYNKKGYNLSGVGNPFKGNLIVVSNVDYRSYKKQDMAFSSQVEIINNVLAFNNREQEQDYFIIPLIRCCESISCTPDDNAINNCIKYFANDVKTYNFKNILLLGSAVNRFLNVNIKDYLGIKLVSKNRRNYFVNYSPLTKFVNNEIFETFERELINWHNYVTNINVNKYKTLNI